MSPVLRAGLTIAVVLVAVALLGAPALAGGGCHMNPATSEGTGSAVEIRNCGFQPVVLFARPGTTVTWTHADGPPHNVVGVGWGSAAAFANGGSAQHTFSVAGIYPYHCSLHPGMAGVVVVGDTSPAGEPREAPRTAVASTEQSPASAEQSLARLDVALVVPALLGAALAGALVARRVSG